MHQIPARFSPDRGTYGAYRARSWIGFEKDVPADVLQSFTAKLDAKIYDLAKNWRPTGSFRPEEVETIVKDTLKLMSSAREALVKAPEKSRDAAQLRRERLGAIEKYAVQATPFITKALTARVEAARTNKIVLVDAPDLKKWVLNGMDAASNGIMSALAQGYFATADLKYFSSLEGQYDLFVFAVKKYAGHVKDAYEGAKDALGYLKPALYIGLGLAGVFVVSRVVGRSK